MDNELVKKIREFNRYYTVWLNVLTKGYLGTDFSWPESRTLFEIWLFPGINATELCEHLGKHCVPVELLIRVQIVIVVDLDDGHGGHLLLIQPGIMQGFRPVHPVLEG